MDGEWSEFAEQFDWSVVMNKSFECSFELLMGAQLYKKLPPTDARVEEDI